MSLSKHVDPDELIASLHEHSHGHSHGHPKIPHTSPHHAHHATQHYTYATRYSAQQSIPKFRMPRAGTAGAAVHQLIKDELDLDGKPNLNLASFVNTFMEPHADQLMAENISKNLADADEYPAVQAIHARCVSMLAHLWHVQRDETAVGTATTGSSEAIHLGGLAMKRRWQNARREQGKSVDRPNILMGANAQVALEKFARYFEVEARILPVSAASHYCLDPNKVAENIDENTIGVFVILGSTYTGHYEPVSAVSRVLDEFEAKTGYSIPIHVDGASGAMVAPFAHASAPAWDFRLPRVHSINTSGHKFGLVYPGLGWIVWRDQQFLPRELVFELHYLGGTEESYTLNFSRPAAQVVAQYFNFLSLGTEGYISVMHNALQNARVLSKALEASGWYTCVSDVHRRKDTWGPQPAGLLQKLHGRVLDEDETDPALYNAGLPVVAFRLSDAFRDAYTHVKQQSVSTLLRARGYIIPNYALPPTEAGVEILRVVVRESMSADLMDRLIGDILAVTEALMTADTVDVECFAQPMTPRAEKHVASLGAIRRLAAGKHVEGDGHDGLIGGGKNKGKGVLNTTC